MEAVHERWPKAIVQVNLFENMTLSVLVVFIMSVT